MELIEYNNRPLDLPSIYDLNIVWYYIFKDFVQFVITTRFRSKEAVNPFSLTHPIFKIQPPYRY